MNPSNISRAFLSSINPPIVASNIGHEKTIENHQGQGWPPLATKKICQASVFQVPSKWCSTKFSSPWKHMKTRQKPVSTNTIQRVACVSPFWNNLFTRCLVPLRKSYQKTRTQNEVMDGKMCERPWNLSIEDIWTSTCLPRTMDKGQWTKCQDMKHIMAYAIQWKLI